MYEKGLLEQGSPTFDFIGKYVNHLEVLTSSGFQTEEVGNFFSNLNYILSNTFGSAYVSPLMQYRECFGEYRILEFLIKIDNLLSAYWLIENRNMQSRIFIILRKMDEIRKEAVNLKTGAEGVIQNYAACFNRALVIRDAFPLL